MTLSGKLSMAVESSVMLALMVSYPCTTNTVIPVLSRVEIQCTPPQDLYNCLPVKGMLTMQLVDVKHVRSELRVGKLIAQLR